MAYTTKICPWCGKKFKGTPNQRFCSESCKEELAIKKKEWKEQGYRYKTDVVIMKHTEEMVATRRRKISLSRKELQPVHVSSSSMQWRYVSVR